jgi:hypothetical protein
MANTLNLYRNGAVGFIVWLDGVVIIFSTRGDTTILGQKEMCTHGGTHADARFRA